MLQAPTRARADARLEPGAALGRLAAWAAGTYLCASGAADPDLYGHLRFGLDLIRTRHLTTVDPYSFTQGVPWTNHEWLSELFFGLAYRQGGIPGLIVLKIAILSAAIVLMARMLRPVGEPHRYWLLAVAIVGLAPIGLAFRPQLWTILALAALCRLLATRRLRWLPLLFAVWANLHGGWIVGLGVAGLWLVGRMLDTRSVGAHLGAVALMGTSLAATLINPYGGHLWGFLASTVRHGRDIGDWRPAWERLEADTGPLWAVTASFGWPLTFGVFGATAIARWRAVTWAGLLPAAWLGIDALFVRRLAPLFDIATVLFVSQAWRRAEENEGARPPVGSARSNRPTATPRHRLLVDAVVVATLALVSAARTSRCLTIETAEGWVPDLLAASAFESPAARGRLVLPFNWGEYAIWHWGPRLLVSMDGRRETVYSEAMIDMQNAGLPAARPDALAFLARERPEYVWLPASSSPAVERWLRSNGYRVDVRTSESFVATRGDLPPLAAGRRMPQCFP